MSPSCFGEKKRMIFTLKLTLLLDLTVSICHHHPSINIPISKISVYICILSICSKYLPFYAGSTYRSKAITPPPPKIIFFPVSHNSPKFPSPAPIRLYFLLFLHFILLFLPNFPFSLVFLSFSYTVSPFLSTLF
jgi:hypothetical protein